MLKKITLVLTMLIIGVMFLCGCNVENNPGEPTGTEESKSTKAPNETDNPSSPTEEPDDGEWDFDDNILLSIFWPPTQEYINDEQWQYMKNAEIDWIMSSGDNLGAKSTQIKMLELCEKYGIHMTVADDRLGSNMLNKSAKTIAGIVEEYKDYEAAKGYYILDEPQNPTKFLNAYIALKNAAPDAYMHLNFLPYGAYSSVESYMAQMDDWCKLCEEAGYPIEYLMYDLYPFGLETNSFSRTAFLTNANAARIVGLENNVKTASYIQSVEQSVAFRSMNKTETLFEMNMSLAFGQKQLSYFTWFTPHDRSEPFADGIISKDGVPNEKYTFICELGHYVHTIGKTLVKCDALEVYTTKTGTEVLEKIPEDFFVQATNKKTDVLVSYMRNKTTTRNYLMIVNNSFTKDTTAELSFINVINSLEVINNETGKAEKLDMKDGNVSLTIEAGGARIIVLPEGFDYVNYLDWTQKEDENVAKYADVYADTSISESGYYMSNLNDGERYSASSLKGWQSANGTSSSIVFKYDKEVALNRVDIYPCGTTLDYGTGFAKNYVVLVSDDGVSYEEVGKLTDYEFKGSVPSITFDATKAKFVKVEISNYTEKYVRICEIEIFYDKGNVPNPESLSIDANNDRGEKVISFKEGKNIALNKSVSVSSYPSSAAYKGWGWWPDFLVDGNKSNGWTSNVKANDTANSIEYAIIDLGDTFYVEKVVVTPNGCWPKDFQILVSKDGQNWETIASETSSKKPSTAYEATASGVWGRYVMFKATKLTSTSADGFMLQLAEIEVYGTPKVDYDEATAILDYYAKNGGDINNLNYTKCLELVNAKAATQTQSGLDKYLKVLLNAMGKTFSDFSK